MYFATTLAVTPSIDPVKVLVDGQTNRVLNVKITSTIPVLCYG
jgi:hypothetical protein